MPASGNPSGLRDKRHVVSNPLTGVRAGAATRPLPHATSRSRSASRRLSSQPDTLSKPLSTQRLMEGWQVYLDNFAALSVTSRKNLSKAQGQLSQWHALARSTWEKWNIPSAKDKSVASSLHAKELGCEIDGERGTLGPT